VSEYPARPRANQLGGGGGADCHQLPPDRAEAPRREGHPPAVAGRFRVPICPTETLHVKAGAWLVEARLALRTSSSEARISPVLPSRDARTAPDRAMRKCRLAWEKQKSRVPPDAVPATRPFRTSRENESGRLALREGRRAALGGAVVQAGGSLVRLESFAAGHRELARRASVAGWSEAGPAVVAAVHTATTRRGADETDHESPPRR
jgi:hypothetical protein